VEVLGDEEIALRKKRGIVGRLEVAHGLMVQITTDHE